jgi:GTPase SAR1 family protein
MVKGRLVKLQLWDTAGQETERERCRQRPGVSKKMGVTWLEKNGKH